jgi:hypothetical protein
VINRNDELLRPLKEVHQINGLRNHFLTVPLRVKKVFNDNTLWVLKTRTICFMRAENVFVQVIFKNCKKLSKTVICLDKV